MPKKFIFHIGPAKTGTSSLQEVLFANRGQLLEQGFDYPGFGRDPNMLQLPGHHGLAAQLRKNGEVPQGVLQNLATLPDDRTVIFSSENLSHLESPAVKALAAACGDAEIEIVYYARRWDQLLPSIWQELVKHGHSIAYLEFLNRQVSAPRASSYLNYAIPLDRWAKVLAPRRLRVFSYDNIRAGGGDIVGHFCEHVLGLTLERDEPRQDNMRQSASLTETMRVLNRLVLGRATPGPQVRYALTRNRAKIEGELAALEKIHKGYVGKAVPCAQMVLEQVQRTFLKKYGHRVENLTENGLLFRKTPFDPAPFVRPDYLFETDALGLYRKIIGKIGERPASAA